MTSLGTLGCKFGWWLVHVVSFLWRPTMLCQAIQEDNTCCQEAASHVQHGIYCCTHHFSKYNTWLERGDDPTVHVLTSPDEVSPWEVHHMLSHPIAWVFLSGTILHQLVRKQLVITPPKEVSWSRLQQLQQQGLLLTTTCEICKSSTNNEDGHCQNVCTRCETLSPGDIEKYISTLK